MSNLKFVKSIVIQYQWIIKLEKIKNNYIELYIIFSNYPINPPLIKINNNNIIINGFINNDKTISIDLINPSNWKITNNLAEIITIIYNCLEESLK